MAQIKCLFHTTLLFERFLNNCSNIAASGAYFIKAMRARQYMRVYCHMEAIDECGIHGGWTLTMKIDGSKVCALEERIFIIHQANTFCPGSILFFFLLIVDQIFVASYWCAETLY